MHDSVHEGMRMSSGPQLSGELHAMFQVESALASLSEDERSRVLRWAGERFGVAVAGKSTAAGRSSTPAAETPSDTVPQTEIEEYPDLAEFFAAAHPKSELDKALVVGYWFQYRMGSTELEAQTINSELKHLGHHVGNITRAFDNLMAREPQLVVQTRKTGSSKQARKKYKLTTAGKKQVEKMLASTEDA